MVKELRCLAGILHLFHSLPVVGNGERPAVDHLADSIEDLTVWDAPPPIGIGPQKLVYLEKVGKSHDVASEEEDDKTYPFKHGTWAALCHHLEEGEDLALKHPVVRRPPGAASLVELREQRGEHHLRLSACQRKGADAGFPELLATLAADSLQLQEEILGGDSSPVEGVHALGTALGTGGGQGQEEAGEEGLLGHGEGGVSLFCFSPPTFPTCIYSYTEPLATC